MRILLLTQWFQPEPQFKGLPLAKALIERGHEVEVLTGFPNYPGGKLYPGYKVKAWQHEEMEGVRVTRAALYPSHDRSAFRRILNYTSFAISSALLCLSLRRPDVIYVYCPPMTAATAAVLLRFLRRVPYVVDIQDLWPDTLASTGMIRDGALMRLVGAWSTFAMKQAACLVVLSDGFRRRLEERDVGRPIRVIPNWAPPEIVEQARHLPPAGEISNRFNILFAGNMGKAQALHTVVSAAQILREELPYVCFTLVGGGVEVEQLRAASDAAGTDNIHFMPQRPASEMGAIYADADALLVHLRDDPLFAITIPSKTQAYLAIGRPILMGVRGDAATMIDEAGAGIVFPPENPRALADAIRSLVEMPLEDRKSMGRAGAAYYADRLAFEHGVSALEQTLVDAAHQTLT